ncbi:hypothetical protein CLV58_1587 [Spirosoma oryzae]|uniref:Uncharacterized protein n=1 Tax=Spirosoma oryzae TaxID=1469603 RepID=A0A2T0RH21_9BACT|nr:hypothetical protein [Spirosoma oryzae]PRY20400.1 hypothetical protein CLV58_1587 [Spirosoma oryzae]
MNTYQHPLTREQIQQAISLLPDEEYNKLTDWLTDHDFQRWDKQIDNELESGRLDNLTDELHQEYSDGKTQPLSMPLSSAVLHRA